MIRLSFTLTLTAALLLLVSSLAFGQTLDQKKAMWGQVPTQVAEKQKTAKAKARAESTSTRSGIIMADWLQGDHSTERGRSIARQLLSAVSNGSLKREVAARSTTDSASPILLTGRTVSQPGATTEAVALSANVVYVAGPGIGVKVLLDFGSPNGPEFDNIFDAEVQLSTDNNAAGVWLSPAGTQLIITRGGSYAQAGDLLRGVFFKPTKEISQNGGFWRGLTTLPNGMMVAANAEVNDPVAVMKLDGTSVASLPRGQFAKPTDADGNVGLAANIIANGAQVVEFDPLLNRIRGHNTEKVNPKTGAFVTKDNSLGDFAPIDGVMIGMDRLAVLGVIFVESPDPEYPFPIPFGKLVTYAVAADGSLTYETEIHVELGFRPTAIALLDTETLIFADVNQGLMMVKYKGGVLGVPQSAFAEGVYNGSALATAILVPKSAPVPTGTTIIP